MAKNKGSTKGKNRQNKRSRMKNNKKEVTKFERLKALKNHQNSARKLLKDIQPGQAAQVMNQVFGIFRPTMSDVPESGLISQLINDFELSQEIKICSTYEHTGENTQITIIQGKTWKSYSSAPDESPITYQEYLDQDLYFNTFEDQPNTRKEILLKICNKEVLHPDENKDPYADWLENGTSIKLHNGSMSGKELLMWDLYSLFDYYSIAIIELANFKISSTQNNPNEKIQMYFNAKNKIKEASEIYDKFLVPSIASVSFSIDRTCDKCKTIELKEINDVEFQCPQCGELVYL